MLPCPHCGRQNTFGTSAEFDFIEDGRFTCEHCHQVFLVLNHVPMTEEQFEATERARETTE
jgi:transposase-like protein